MKKQLIGIFCAILIGLVSCDKKDNEDSEYANYVVAKPIKVTKEAFKNGVDVISPLPVNESGKIYAYKNYIFINEKYKGVHVVDNSNPSAPVKIAFIKIAGNVDISVKEDYLYADSITDLVVLDISDINAIKQINRLENVFRDQVFFPIDVDFYDEEEIDYDKEIIVGWETVTEKRLISSYQQRSVDRFLELASVSDASLGQGGSLARFKIVANYLYAVDNHNINIFDIQNLEAPKDLEDVYAGFDIETIFNKGEHLYLGSRRGMYIYNIKTPSKPIFVSEFEHGTACDPVVVDDTYAYVTLRGGNSCGATESGLFIIDLSDITKPILKETYPMNSPYGLGIKEEKLFVCDGDAGLKVYDKTNIENLIPLNHFKNITTFDVIPLEESLLMIGEGILYQYEYEENNITLLSTLAL